MPSTFTFEEAQEEQPKTFSFEEALGEPAAPDLSKIKLSPYEQAIEANRGMRPESGMEPGTEFTTAVASGLPGALSEIPGQAIQAAGKTALGIANLPTSVANRLRGQQPGMPGYVEPLENLPRPSLPRFEGDKYPRIAGVGNVLAQTGEQVLPVFAPPEVGLTLPLLGVNGLIARVGAAAFGYEVLKSLPEEVRQAIATVKDPNASTREKVEAVGKPSVNSVLGALMAHGAVGKASVKAPLEDVAARTGQLSPDVIRLRPEGEPIFGAEPLPSPSPIQIAPGAAVAMQLPARSVSESGSPDMGDLLSGANRMRPFRNRVEAPPNPAEVEQAMLDVGRRAGQVIQPMPERAEVAQVELPVPPKTSQPETTPGEPQAVADTASTPVLSGKLALQFGEWDASGKLKHSNRVLAVTDLQDAQRKWDQIRDAEGWGASESPIVHVVDTETGERIAKVSYNGRLWAPDGTEIKLTPPPAEPAAVVQAAPQAPENPAEVGQSAAQPKSIDISKLSESEYGKLISGERPVSAATELDDGTILEAAAHPLIQIPKGRTIKSEGFVTNKRRYVDRDEAAMLTGGDYWKGVQSGQQSGAAESVLTPPEEPSPVQWKEFYRSKVEPTPPSVEPKPSPDPTTVGEEKQGGAKEPWQMTRSAFGSEANAKASQSKNIPPLPPPDYEVLKALSNRNNRKPYNPDLLTDEALGKLGDQGLITGSPKRAKFTQEGFSKLADWERTQREHDLALGRIADEAVDKAMDEHKSSVEQAIKSGKPVPPEVLADYPDLKPTPPPEPKPGRDWELFNEQLQEELDSFNPARTTGRINYELNDVADRFVDFAKNDKSGKPLVELVKDFSETDDATPSQIKKLAQSVKSLTAQEKPEPKPATAAVEGVEQTKPAETHTPTVAPPGEKGKGVDVRKNAAEFKRLVLEHGERFGWVLNPDAIVPELEGVKTHLGTAAMKAKVAHDKEASLSYKRALKDLGITVEKNTPKAQADALPKLKEFLTKQANLQHVPLDQIPDGSEFTISGEKYHVKGTNPDTGIVTIVDGRTLKVDENATVGIDPGSLKAAKVSTEFAPEEKPGFELAKPESVEEQKTRLAKEEEARKKKAAHEELAARAAKPLTGGTGDLGQKTLTGEGEDLFAAAPKPPTPATPMAGPGSPSRTQGPDVTGAQIQQLSEAFRQINAQKVPLLQRIKEAFNFGQKRELSENLIARTLSALKTSGDYLIDTWKGQGDVDPILKAKGELSAELETRGWRLRQAMKDMRRAVPSKAVREAISKYVDAGGDIETLRRSAEEVPATRRAAYLRALQLTPEEKIVAGHIQSYFESRLQEAIDAGVLSDGIEDYIHRIYPKDTQWRRGVINAVQNSLLDTRSPGLARKRVFELDAEAEKAGFMPVSDFIPRILDYEASLSKVIASRKAVQRFTEIRMPDGRPMLDAAGIGTPLENQQGIREATLIRPSFKPGQAQYDERGNPTRNNRKDYQSRDYPALKRWRWASNDSEGNPIFVQGDVLIHPDAVHRIDALLEPSKVRKHAAARAALTVGSVFKQTMLDFSGFHQVQIAIHGLEHKVNPFHLVKDVDTNDPNVQGLLRGGMTLGGTHVSGLYQEGLVGRSLSRQIPGLGELMQSYHDWLFQNFIPRVKTTMALHALDRNRARFSKDLASGKMTEAALFHQTAKEANAAFGELNYIMLERSKTAQDMARLVLLAPDFLEARGRFALQAGTRLGGEQRMALLLGAITLYTTARLMNKALNDEWHFEPENMFSVIHNGKAYSIRTVQGDILHALTSPVKFWLHRLNPTLTRPLFELMSGRDEFGRKRDFWQVMGDTISNAVPISFRNSREQSIWTSLLNAFGGSVRRDSDVARLYRYADEWKQKNNVRTEPGEFIYDPSKDIYRPLKLALLDGDISSAAVEYRKLIASKVVTPDQALKHFQTYANTPFSGSKKNEPKFFKSLTADQQHAYHGAKQEKERILKEFLKARAISK